MKCPQVAKWSLCVFSACTAKKGLAVVDVSPLIALWYKIGTVVENNGIGATFLNSTLTSLPSEVEAILMVEMKLLYITQTSTKQVLFYHLWTINIKLALLVLPLIRPTFNVSGGAWFSRNTVNYHAPSVTQQFHYGSYRCRKLPIASTRILLTTQSKQNR